MNDPSMYRDQEVIVLGLARSGAAVAKLFHEYGAKVMINDRKERHLCPEADELESLGISVVCGGHPSNLIHSGISLIVKNPGIPYSIPPIQQALEMGLEIVTEVEVAYRICRAPIIGISGSNGKTTTTTWVGQILEAAGKMPIVAGNIGIPLCEAATESSERNTMVVELSSFQLKGTDQFRPFISCLLNISETHMDYHGTMEDYIDSKAKLFANQTEEDIAVLNWDDAHCLLLASRMKASILPFSLKQSLPYGVFLNQDIENIRSAPRICYRDRHGEMVQILATNELGIPGSHNVENALAATAIALAAGVEPSIITQCLREFHGVEHRLEFVAEKGGILYYNNSKATNVTATARALESFDQQIVLIAGGQDRMSEFFELQPLFHDKVKALVALGETKHKIIEVARSAGLSHTKSVDTANDAATTMRNAVELAKSFAEEGDIVLLSPACASWDMFTSYEERGRIFKESVHNL